MGNRSAQSSFAGARWSRLPRRYLAFITPAHLAWEFAQMPLFTLWLTGSTGEIIFAGLHCTGGDILIGMSSLILALLLFGRSRRPLAARRSVMIATLMFGFGYTLFSEWLNVTVRAS